MFHRIFPITYLLIIFTALFLPPVKAQDQNRQPLTVTINANDKAQTIHNIGASGCWFSEGIGRLWPQDKKERIAELLFSRKMDGRGNPKGIGLSAWRFNIGGGTTEQGDSSGIKDVNRRVECFLNPDGTYNWNKQPGYQWFLRKAKEYGVENLIAFSNTPPVHFNQNGLGFKTVKDYKANLKPDKYFAYADFLTEVIRHFDKEGLHFSYISPVNEPQWDWSNKFGQASQEGSPWSNEEIYRVLTSLDSSLKVKGLETKILTTEAAMLTYLYDGSSAASHQVQQFFDKSGRLSISRLTHVPKLIAGHSYFTDSGDSNIVTVRRHLADTVKKYGVEYWQSEYSMLGDGFREGSRERRSAMDCGLFLAKIIHHDLTVANASAWQYWNAYEPGNPAFNTRYYLIALQPDSGFTNGSFTETKNLWALGHYSLFIRPSMQRLAVQRSDHLNAKEEAQQIMISAFKDDKGKMVLVAINYTRQDQNIRLQLKNFKKIKTITSYVTTALKEENMKAAALKNIKDNVALPPRSITTLVLTP